MYTPPDNTATLQHLPDIGDLVFLLGEDGTIQNPKPWAIIDIGETPDGRGFALFEETATGWPLERCRIAEEARLS